MTCLWIFLSFAHELGLTWPGLATTTTAAAAATTAATATVTATVTVTVMSNLEV